MVGGVASLMTKRFREAVPSVEPKPTLLKAAMIATADSLGPVNALTGQVSCTDCRPSQKYGWGLLNLDRLTATTPARYFVNETAPLAGVGSFWPTTQQLFQPDDPALPILIALVWNDIPELRNTHPANWALKRDLDLWVYEHNGPGFWAGNSFAENVVGLDTGWSQAFGFWNGTIPDTVNTVEAVFIPPGWYDYLNAPRLLLRVDDITHTNFPALPAQPFSIYAWNLKPCVTKCGN